MMSYTIACTSLCSSGGMLTRFTSPSTRIIGGTPEDKCRSEAPCLTAKLRSWAMSTIFGAGAVAAGAGGDFAGMLKALGGGIPRTATEQYRLRTCFGREYSQRGYGEI